MGPFRPERVRPPGSRRKPDAARGGQPRRGGFQRGRKRRPGKGAPAAVRCVDNLSIKCQKMLKRVDNFRQQPGFQPIGFVDNLMNRGPFLSITAQIYHRRTPLVKRSGKIFSKMWKKLRDIYYKKKINELTDNRTGKKSFQLLNEAVNEVLKG